MTNLVRARIVAPGGLTVTPKTRIKMSPELAAAEIGNLQSIPGDPKFKGPQAQLVDGAHKPVRDFTIRRGAVIEVDLSTLPDSQRKSVEVAAADEHSNVDAPSGDAE